MYFEDRPAYVVYRSERIPGWWEEHLPNEKNPYDKTDTLTLNKGCLSNYWHFHSSNKHPYYKGAEACNFVQNLVRNRFGEAFLVNKSYGCRRGEHLYSDAKHIIYNNATIGDDGNIHIADAWQYYEDVITFVKLVLRQVSKNHMPSPLTYNAESFFPMRTDKQLEEHRISEEKKKEETAKLKSEMSSFVTSDDFFIDTLIFDKATFNALWDIDDGWFNVDFRLYDKNDEKGVLSNPVQSNIDSEMGVLKVLIDVPHMYGHKCEKKNKLKATKILDIPFGLYLITSRENTYRVITPIPKEKVSDKIIEKVNNVCNEAMDEYNSTHMDLIEHENCGNKWSYYPENYWLDNNIGRINLVYEENAGRFSWRYRWL